MFREDGWAFIGVALCSFPARFAPILACKTDAGFLLPPIGSAVAPESHLGRSLNEASLGPGTGNRAQNLRNREEGLLVPCKPIRYLNKGEKGTRPPFPFPEVALFYFILLRGGRIARVGFIKPCGLTSLSTSRPGLTTEANISVPKQDSEARFAPQLGTTVN